MPDKLSQQRKVPDDYFQTEALARALEIAVITKLTLKSFNIKGCETLNIDAVDDPESPYHGRIPIPTVLDAQIDRILMDRMNILQKKCFSEIKKIKTMKGKRENWYMIFLTILILSYNLGAVYQNQQRQKQRYGKNVCSSLSQVVLLILSKIQDRKQDAMLASWDYGAKVLRWYFRKAYNGDGLLSMDWENEASQFAGVDPMAKRFMVKLRSRMASRGKS